jgi:nucleoside-diphosphate-sugar epimerase
VNPPRSPVNFLTGGTGFLGSHIAAELLRRGEEVFFLIRGSSQTQAAKRLQKILDWHAVDSSRRVRAHPIEGDLGNPGLGMDGPRIPRVDRIIHCASDTSFSERNRSRIWAANVVGLDALLDFAALTAVPSFVDVSTAYVAGRRSGPCHEEPPLNREFYNVYEESKAAAERMLLDRCRAEDIRLTILRPSIVYGHSRTGRTFRFNALYYPVKTALFLRRIFEEDIRERGGEKASAVGVSIDPDGTARLPLRIEVNEKGGVNLIPIDFFVDAFFAVLDASLDGGIYHIVNRRLTKIENIIRYAQKQFKLKGIRSCGPEEFLRTPRSSLEQLFERYLEAYAPYMKDTRIFLTDKTDPILKRRGIECPEFDEAMFRRCMSYAVDNGWNSLSL